MATYVIKAPDGKEYEVDAPEGATEQDVLNYVKQSTAKREDGGFIRQAGLTARNALQGVGNTLGLFSDPIAVGLNAMGMNIPSLSSSTEAMLDKTGLPKPSNPVERVVGKGVELAAGGGAMGAGMRSVPALAAAGKNLGMQALSGFSGGVAGQIAKEYNAHPATQFGASFLATMATPMAANSLNKLGGYFDNLITPSQQTTNVNVIIQNALRDRSIPAGVVGGDVMNVLRQDIERALKISPNLSPDAVRRLVDYRLTGLTPTRGRLTLNPVDITREKNLAKIGANQGDERVQSLAMLENQNNVKLIENMNTMGAGKGDPYAAGKAATESLQRLDAARRGQIGSLYENARNAAGINTPIDPSGFTQSLFQRLDDQMVGDALPGGIRAVLNDIATGKMPFTIQKAEQIRQALNAQVSGIPSRENAALKAVRDALDDAIYSTGAQSGDDAANAFAAARGAAQARFKRLEQIPGYKAAVDGASPDDFVQKFIINGKVMDVAKLKTQLKSDGETMQAVREAVTAYLKNKALSGASDEVGKFSQAGYNNAIAAIGDRKLRMLFSPEEFAKLKTLGRVAAYEMVQPKGSAVNNSNSGALIIGDLLDKIARSPLLSKIPLGGLTADKVINPIATSISAGPSVNIPASLAAPGARIPYQPPYAVVPGLLPALAQ